MSEFFVNHDVCKIQLAQPWLIAIFVFVVVVSCSIVSVLKREIVFLDLGSFLFFRGMAILLLLCGHFAEMCLPHDGHLPVDGGFLAVCSFLFMSGYGLVQSYGHERIGHGFWPKRLLRLFIPLWLTLTLFILLDQLLLDLSHPAWEIVMNYCGIMFNGAFVRVNSPAWFVDYILLQYLTFFFVFWSRLGIYSKIALLFALSVAVSATIFTTFLFDYFSIWLQYTLVFPLGVLFAVLSSKSSIVKRFINGRGTWYVALLLSALSFFTIIGVGAFLPQIGYHPKLFFQQIAVIVLIVSGGKLMVALRAESRFLVFLGKYSYEIFLLHLPFMVKYDFILFRQPFIVSCIVYFCVIVLLAMGLQRISNVIRRLIEARFVV